MKPWIKLETALLDDERIKRLIKGLGVKGLGLYVVIRIALECRNGRMPLAELLRFLAGYCSQRMMRSVINDFGLFGISENIVRASVPASVPACVPASVPAAVPASVPAGEHISDENRDIDIYSSIGSSGGDAAADDDAVCFSKYRGEPWYPRIGELLSANNMMWREPLLMHCGYGALLGSHWQQAVLFFVEHVIIQNELQRMATEKDCRQYFANFSRISTPSGRALMEHLRQLTPEQAPAACYDGPPVPQDAPPRPSPTAQWDNATDSWTEVH